MFQLSPGGLIYGLLLFVELSSSYLLIDMD